MGRAEGSGIIDSNREDIFYFTDWCYNDPQWAPSIKKAWITKLPDSEGRGKISHYMGNVMGRNMEWEGVLADWKPSERWTMKAISGRPAWMNMQTQMWFEQVGPGKTKVTIGIEYRAPYPIIGWLIDNLYLRRQAARMVRNGIGGMMKAAAEHRIPPIQVQRERRKADHPGYEPQ